MMSSLYNKAINVIPVTIGGAGVIGATTLILVGVVASNLQLSISGVQTLSQLVLVWISFLLAGALAVQERHIKVDYFVDRLPEAYQRYHQAMVLVLNIVVCLTLVWGAIVAIETFWDSVAPGAVRIWGFEETVPVPLYYAAPAIGMGLLAIAYVVQFAELWGIISLSDGEQS